jgi:peptidoglycan/LPS O-acetylase OafA/YrhL
MHRPAPQRRIFATKPQERYVFLDGLRGLAALSVAAFHAAIIFGHNTDRLNNVALAVDFFFCLSGFVVAHAYDARLTSGQLSVKEFMVKRLIRLYPMILLGVAIGAAAHILTMPGQVAVTLQEALQGSLLIPRIDGALSFPLNGPMWSLVFEIAACLGYAIVIKIFPRWALTWLLCLSGAALLAGAISANHIYTFGVAGTTGLAAGSVRVAFPFLLGVLMQRSRIWERMPSIAPFLGAVGLLLILWAPLRASGPYQAVAAMLLLPTIVAVGSATTVRRTALWTFLGRLSYPLYIVHWPVLLVVKWGADGRISSPAADVAGVAIAVTVAWLCVAIFDEPVRRWLGSARRQSGAHAATEPA